MVIAWAMEGLGDEDEGGVNGRGIDSGRGSLSMALASCPALAVDMAVDICVFFSGCLQLLWLFLGDGVSGDKVTVGRISE